tara:strand:- start:13 stop:297 length:285 start_codon:yes stop_codon:yes gene_type:complete
MTTRIECFVRNRLSNNAKIQKEDKFDSGSTGLLQAALGSLEDMGLGGVIAGVAQMSVDEGGFLFTAEGEEILGELQAGAGLSSALVALGGIGDF